MTFDIRILITTLISSNFSTIPLWQELKIWCVCEAFSDSCYNYSILYTTVLLSQSYTMFFNIVSMFKVYAVMNFYDLSSVL
jgi:hypothetical protein